MKSMRSTVKCRDEYELFKTLSEELPVGVCIMQDGKFCYVNSTFPIAIGYTVDELVGKDSLEIVVPEDREMVKKNTMKMLKGELRSPYQFRVTGKDGSTVWVMATVKSIQYRGRRAVLGNYMEVTERKRMEEAAKNSEDRYRELANSITNVFFAMDEHLRYTYWNKASETLTGIRAEDAIGKSLLEVFPDTPWRRKAEEIYRKVLNTQQFQSFVSDYSINGRHCILEINAYPSRSGISVFVKDITEHERAEEALRESEERYRALFDSSLDCVYINDFEGNFLDANGTALKLFGYEKEDIPHLNFASLLSEDQLPKAIATLQELKDTGAQRQLNEFRVRCKDGSFVDVEVIAAVIYRDGKPYAIQGVGRDITERKRAEQWLREAEEEKSAFLEEAPVAIIHTDLDGKITYVNSRFELESGYPREEIIGKVGLQLGWFSADTTKYLTERMAARLRGDPARHWQTRFKCRDGRLIWIELEGKVISKLGVPVGFQVISNNVTERKEAEESLRQSEERYRTVLEEMEEGYYEVDVAGNFTLVNDAMSRILGYSRDELIGMNYKIYTPKEHVNPVFQAYNRVYRTGEPLKWFPMPEIRKDGRQILAEDSVFPLRNERGEVVGFRGITRDITERRRAEEALRQSEEKYRTILEEMEDAYFEVDLGGHLTFVNSSTCRNLGYSREELIGMSYKDFTAEDDIESVFRVFNEVYQSGLPNKGFPWKILRKDGGHGFAEASVSLLQNDKGQIIGFRGVGRDVTERKQAEEKLRQSEENYRTLFNSSVIGTVVLDAETMRIVMLNEAAAKIFGFGSPQEGTGQNPLDFVPPEKREMIREAIRQDLFERDIRQTAEFRALTRSGREIWLSVTAARIMHEGKSAGLISFTDITRQKRQSERLMMTDRLASIGELAAGAAHELNNPLTSIIGLSELLMERDTSDYIRRDLAMIRSEAQRAANVTSNLLTFARKHRPVKQPTQVNDVIEDVLKLRAYAHKSNCIEVERHLAFDLPEIPIDRFQMQQVFLNIVINAEYFIIQAHKRGTLAITTKGQNGTVVISFADDGPGIPPENLKRIFDPFFTTKEAGKGTGLGLSICHGIVAEHGGQIYAASQPGKGATIVIELPINGNSQSEVRL